MAIADFGGTALGQPIDDSHRRSSEQAGHRPAEISRMGRHQRPDDAARRLQHRRQPRAIDAATRRRKSPSSPSARRARRSPARTARPIRSITATTRPRSPTARPRRSSNRAARAGSSSPRTMPSASQLEKGAADVVKAGGGTVVGDVRVPLGTSDFASYLLQAQGSGAQVLGLANAGTDFSNSLKAAAEFGLTKSMQPAALLVFLTDVHAVGLDIAQGLVLTDGLVLGPRRPDARLRQALQRQDQARCRHSRRRPSILRPWPISTPSRRPARPTPTR